MHITGRGQKDGGERRWEMLGRRERTTPSTPFQEEHSLSKPAESFFTKARRQV